MVIVSMYYRHSDLERNRHSDLFLGDPIWMGNSIGERIKELRGKRTQAEIATPAGISQGALSDIESGVTKEVGAVVLWGIARALKTTCRYLITGRGGPGLGLPDDPDEADVILFLRTMEEDRRDAWLESGRALAKSKLVPGAETPKKRIKQG